MGALTSDEATVIKGALDLASKTAEAVMTPLNKARVQPHPQQRHGGQAGRRAGRRASLALGAARLGLLPAPAAVRTLPHLSMAFAPDRGRVAPPPSPPLQVFMLRTDAVIDAQLLSLVLAAGHSRVPVHDGENKQVCVCL